MGVDPDDVLPPAFHLEMIAEKRFGGRLDRLSRVVSIDPVPPPAHPRPAGPAGTGSARPVSLERMQGGRPVAAMGSGGRR
jgi:hypothetical protein